MEESQRRFHRLSTITTEIPLPKRSTVRSAGYDISIIHPIVFDLIKNANMDLETAWKEVVKTHKETFYLPENKVNYLFPTGLKVQIPDNTQEFLAIFIRSSVGVKQGIKLSNQTAIIDADYYNNKDNEGHILIPLDIPLRNNPGQEPSLFLEPEYVQSRYLTFDGPTMRICQGIFLPYAITNDDRANGERVGGLGSTGK